MCLCLICLYQWFYLLARTNKIYAPIGFKITDWCLIVITTRQFFLDLRVQEFVLILLLQRIPIYHWQSNVTYISMYEISRKGEKRQKRVMRRRFWQKIYICWAIEEKYTYYRTRILCTLRHGHDDKRTLSNEQGPLMQTIETHELHISQ